MHKFDSCWDKWTHCISCWEKWTHLPAVKRILSILLADESNGHLVKAAGRSGNTISAADWSKYIMWSADRCEHIIKTY